MPSDETPPGAEAPADGSAAPDYGTWFEGAGLDAKELPDPAEISNARALWEKHGGETDLYTTKQLEERAQGMLRDHLNDPKTYQSLKDFYRQELEAETRQPPQQQPAGDGDGEPGGEAWKGALQQMEERLGQRFQPVEQALSQYFAGQQEQQKEAKDAEWKTEFDGRVEDAAKRANNGVIEHEALVGRMKELYGLGKIPDHSPASLARHAKEVIQAKLAEQAKLIERLGIGGLLQQRQQNQLPPEMKIDDVVQDDEKLEKLLGQIMERGMPADAE